MNKYVRLLISLPKIVYINMRLFPIKDAMKMPLLVSFDTKFKAVRGSVVLHATPHFGMVKIGISEGSFNLSRKETFFEIARGGNVYLGDGVNITRGATIFCGKSGKLEVGNNFFCNSNFLCIVSSMISFGSDCILGWNCKAIDGDGHRVVDLKTKKESVNRPIRVGNHVWLAAEVSLLKGSEVLDNSVVGYGSILSGKYDGSGVVVGNERAKVLKEGIDWKL